MTDIQHQLDPITLALQSEQVHSNWTTSMIGKIAAGGIVAAELTPLNEAMRFTAWGIALKYTDPVTASLVAGLSTAAIEGGAAIATADLLDNDSAQRLVGKINSKLTKVMSGKQLKTGVVAEAGLAAFGGTAVAVTAMQLQDPTRTRVQNRKYGIKSAAGLSVLTTGQTLLAGEGLYHIPTPVLAAGALAVAAVVGGSKWLKGKRSVNKEPTNPDENHEAKSYDNVLRATKEVVSEGSLLAESVKRYELLTYDEDAPQHLGLVGEEISKALTNPDVIKAVYKDEDGSEYVLPLLVPLKELYWYNTSYLAKKYGTEKLYYFCHTPGQIDENDPRFAALKDVTEAGGVIIYDTTNQPKHGVKGDLKLALGKSSPTFDITRLGDEQGNFLNQYSTRLNFNDSRVPTAYTLFEQYQHAIAEGEIKADPLNGVAMEEVIEGDEAHKIWDMYNGPFEKIGEKHPIGAGFDKKGFLEILRDPEVVKVLNRQDGRVTTLTMLVNNFDHCPWLNREYYKKNHSAEYDAKNIVVFTGIVADQTVKGSAKSLALITLLTKIAAMRAQPTIITFECNDVSARYVPRIVQMAINRSGYGRVDETIRDQDSQLNYFSVKKTA